MHLASIARTRLAGDPLALPRGRPMTLGARLSLHRLQVVV
jgi:hypothetical protein